MSFLAINYGHYEFWNSYDPANGFYGPQKCVFDGPNKLIIVSDGVTELDIRQDVYSDWKEWVQYGDNSKYLEAIRTTGGDPIAGTTTFTGDVYFLINGWRLVINITKVAVTGVLYSDDFATAYYTQDLLPQFPVRVSSIVNTIAVETIGGITVPSVQDIRNELDVNSVKLASIDNKVQTLNNGPSSTDIALAVRAELTPELTHLLSLQNGQGLDSTQATMLLEIYRLYGLDPTKPLVVTKTTRSAGAGISQNITTNDNQTTITRV